MPSEAVEELVARAQAGEVRAFEQLVTGLLPRVRRFARAFAASEADADDLAQDALLRVHRNVRLYRHQSAFSTWVFAVVRNVFLDAAKGRAGRSRALEDPLEDEHRELGGGTRPDEALASAEDRRRVWAALRRVPAEFRTALVLFDVEGATYDEIAAVEGIAVGTVKSRLHRGRAHLRRLLEEDGPPLEAPAAAPGTSEGVPPSHLGRRP